MKKFTTKDLNGQKYNGGLPFNWNDLEFIQNGINESFAQLVKSLCDGVNIAIVSGCEDTYLVFYISSQIRISAGLIAYNGEICTFSGIDYSGEFNKAWFVISQQYDSEGAKTVQSTQQTVQCYAVRSVVVEVGDEYPEGVEGVDYIPIVNDDSGSSSAMKLKSITQHIADNSKPKVIFHAKENASGWNDNELFVCSRGAVVQIYGYMKATVLDATDNTLMFKINSVKPYADSRRKQRFTVEVRDENDDFVKFGSAYLAGSSCYLDGVDVSEGTRIYISQTFLIDE